MIASLARQPALAGVTAGGLFAAAVLVAALAPRERELDLQGVLLLLAACAPLALRYRWPLAVLAAVLLGSIAYHALGYPHDAMLPAVLLALYTVAVARSRRHAFLAGCAVVALVLVVAAMTRDGEMVDTAGWLVAAVGLGVAVRAGRAYAAEVELRAEEADRSRAAESDRLAAEIRLGLARDVHDVLAHGITTISVQAGVAEHLLNQADDVDRDRLTQALDAVATSCRRISADVHLLLSALRDNLDDVGTEPPPSLSRIAQLVAQTVTGTVRTHLEIVGAPRPVPPTIEITAYRVVQEALTNVLKHARASQVVVRLEYRRHALLVRVTDDGVGCMPREPGHGLIGMSERVRLVGGVLIAEPAAEGGFSVSARLPIPGNGGDHGSDQGSAR